MSAASMAVQRNAGLMSSERQGLRRYRLGILLSGLLSVVLVWGAWQLMNPATLPIRQVSIEGEFRHLVPMTMEQTVAEVVRGGFFNVNVEKIQETLLMEPWVRHVAVRRVWPDAITVFVQEQTAFVRWGELGVLNQQAEFFAPKKETVPEGLPTLHGPENSQALLLQQFNQATQILSAGGLKVSAMTLNERRAWDMTLENGVLVSLGRKNVNKRLRRFADYVMLQMSVNLDEVAAIDMRYTNGFAVRLKNGPTIVESRQETHG